MTDNHKSTREGIRDAWRGWIYENESRTIETFGRAIEYAFRDFLSEHPELVERAIKRANREWLDENKRNRR